MKKQYVHGYDFKETRRLQDQASTLEELLHSDTNYPDGSIVLEAGCGVGAQTIALVKNSPKAFFTSIDISEESLKTAEAKIKSAGYHNVEFRQADIFNLPFQSGMFDHIFICFVLEHIQDPVNALLKLKFHLKPGGSVTVIEGDHGSAYFYPDSQFAHKAIHSLVTLQRKSGGNPMIGRELYPLLNKAGFKNVSVSPRMVYVDSSRPELVEGFTRNTFTAMIEGVRNEAVKANLIDETIFDQGISDLYRTAESEGVFCYTFFKATAINI
jgi:ubiquinone/menaquinone biosynthesis C-methylase UbiE